MAMRSFSVPDVGTVYVYKRRGSRNIRLSVNSDGKIRVNQPVWLPYKAGVTFAKQKSQWLSQQQRQDLTDGQVIGKYHQLVLVQDKNINKVSSRLADNEAVVTYPAGSKSADIQEAAQKVAKRALRRQAQDLLPARLRDLAALHGFEFKAVNCRHLKSRWGSCSNKQNITLNYYLMQLPWQLIDYVLIHELVHTRHMNHSSDFWGQVAECLPDYKQLRQQLKAYQPSVLLPKSTTSMT